MGLKPGHKEKEKLFLDDIEIRKFKILGDVNKPIKSSVQK
jgi:hypothetical protein